MSPVFATTMSNVTVSPTAAARPSGLVRTLVIVYPGIASTSSSSTGGSSRSSGSSPSSVLCSVTSARFVTGLGAPSISTA